MKKLLLIVDYQNDFVDMALATKDSEKCYPHILNLIEEYQKRGMTSFLPVIPMKKITFRRKKENTSLSSTALKALRAGNFMGN